jgi:diguanylate cyclase (GGDEF)-like protein
MPRHRLRLPPHWKTGLGAKFALLVAVILVVTLGINAVVGYRFQTRLFLDNLIAKNAELGNLFASISPEPLLSHDYLTLDQYAREVTRHEDIVYATVRAPGGRYLTLHLDAGKPEVAAAIDGSGGRTLTQVMPILTANTDIIHFSLPIDFNGERLGEVLLGVSRNQVDAHAGSELQRQLLISSVIILVLALLIYVSFRHSALRPIQRLIRAANEVAHGHLDQHLAVRARDELGQLTTTFNAMAHDLKDNIAEKDRALTQLQELNRTLEARVETRTRELGIANLELEHQALHDALTGLPNRLLIQDRLNQAIRVAERDGSCFAVIMMDLDRFKEINDNLGHNVGDHLLKEVGQRLRLAVRAGDTVGRLGGDEFAIIVPRVDCDRVLPVAHNLLHSLAPSFLLEGTNFSIGASLGIAVFPLHGRDSLTLLKRADVAMYVAKQNRAGLYLYDIDQDSNSPNRLALLSELKEALEHNTLRLNYQPIVNLTTNRIVGVEALARWPHPSRGLIPQELLISMVEQSDMIQPFTLWVLDTAMAQWHAWQSQEFPLRLSVNLSMRNLRDDNLPNELAALISKWGMLDDHLLLEITESAVMDDPVRAHKILGLLRAMKVHVAIDDFGIGYSSLSHLSKLPVTELKIDRAFVRNMDNNPHDVLIVRSTVDLAHNLGLRVVAEGVESLAVLEMLRELRCDMAQGYYLGYPQSAATLTELLREARESEKKGNVRYLGG